MAKAVKVKPTEETITGEVVEIKEQEVISEPVELTDEEKIIDYIAKNNLERVELNPIIRSLYPMPSYNSPALFLQQGESKRIKGMLSKMKSDGIIALTDDSHLKLGGFYYDSDLRQKHYNLDTVKIYANKIS